MKATIKKQDLEQEFFTEEQCYITEISNSADDPQLSIARARLEPGITTRWHRLASAAERYYILEGEGLAEVGDLAPQKVVAGDVVLIPPKRRQRITNTGSVDLVFLALCTPPFTEQDYEDIEDSQAQGLSERNRGR